ncbi:MAG: universal stress protein [Haloarculaceae archaeon]
MYETILVPTDGSEPALEAARHAVSLAAALDATVHALFVANAAAEAIAASTAVVSDADEALVEEGREATAEVADLAADAGVDCRTAVLDGVPYETILDYADDHEVDCLVVGTHGRTGLEHAVLGSTTERVVRRSPVPVVTVYSNN